MGKFLRMPSHVANKEFKLQKSLSSGAILGRPNQLWWPNHQGWGVTRDLAEGPDPHRIHDCDGYTRKCMDRRFHELAARDHPTKSFQKFGPNQDDIENGKGKERQVDTDGPAYAGMVN